VVVVVVRAPVRRRRSFLNRKLVSPLRRQGGVRWLVGVVVIATLVIARTALSRRTQTPTPIDFGMALIPAGYYSIGVDVGAANVRPAHRVRLAAFGLDKREATVADFRAFAVATNARTPWTEEPPANDHNGPVTGVNWSDASSFCLWRHPRGGRLPTEEEWEAAARGVAGWPYPWGFDFVVGNANTLSANRAGPVPTGSFPNGATPAGVQDLIGNVWEWTSSLYHAYPRATPFADSMQQFRVVRGGAFSTPDSIATALVRGYNRPIAPRDQLALTGFRCAMNARQDTAAK
jgi:formylglycine-generating enzyme required for sulfatase activity